MTRSAVATTDTPARCPPEKLTGVRQSRGHQMKGQDSEDEDGRENRDCTAAWGSGADPGKEPTSAHKPMHCLMRPGVQEPYLGMAGDMPGASFSPGHRALLCGSAQAHLLPPIDTLFKGPAAPGKYSPHQLQRDLKPFKAQIPQNLHSYDKFRY